jgi:hypothetical protein
MVTMGLIPTLRTVMLSDRQPFTHRRKTGRAGLTGTIGVDFGKVHSPFPAHPLHQRQKLSEGSIHTIVSQPPSRQPFDVEVFCKDGLRLVAKCMSRLQMKVFATVCDSMVHPCHFNLRFLPVLRTLLFSYRSALQQFQLALHRLEKLRSLLERAI